MAFEILETYTKRTFIGRVYFVVAKDKETGWTVKAGFTSLPTVVRILEGLNYELKEMKDSYAFEHLKGKVLE